MPLLKRAYDRALEMEKDGVVSDSALDDAQKNYQIARPTRSPLTDSRLARQTQLGSFTGLCPARGDGGEGGLWVAGMHGLAKAPGPLRNLKAEDEWREYPVPTRAANRRSPGVA